MDAQLTKTRQENFCTWRPDLEREEARSRLIGNSLTNFHQIENARTVQENSEGSGGSSAPVRGRFLRGLAPVFPPRGKKLRLLKTRSLQTTKTRATANCNAAIQKIRKP
jgi:hypothetical protein